MLKYTFESRLSGFPKYQTGTKKLQDFDKMKTVGFEPTPFLTGGLVCT